MDETDEGNIAAIKKLVECDFKPPFTAREIEIAKALLKPRKRGRQTEFWLNREHVLNFGLVQLRMVRDGMNKTDAMHAVAAGSRRFSFVAIRDQVTAMTKRFGSDQHDQKYWENFLARWQDTETKE